MWIDIKKNEPTFEYAELIVKTDSGKEFDAIYMEEYDIFFVNHEDYFELGWKDNGENPELVNTL